MTARDVEVTWFSVANCLMTVGDTSILVDGYVTRLPLSVFADPDECTTSIGPQLSDAAAVRRTYEELGSPSIQTILTSHAHFDHTWDTAEWAKLTGATVVGTETVALQCVARGVPRSQMQVVDGGEALELPSGVQCHVVRANHAGDDKHRALGRQPRTLEAIPEPDPDSGGLRPGVYEDFPNGGGSLSYVFALPTDDGPISWAHTASLSAFDFDDPLVIDGRDVGSPAANLSAAMSAAGLSHVDLWLGPARATAHAVAAPILHPITVVPMHWDDLFAARPEDDTSVYDVAPLQAVYGDTAEVRVPVYLERYLLTPDRRLVRG